MKTHKASLSTTLVCIVGFIVLSAPACGLKPAETDQKAKRQKQIKTPARTQSSGSPMKVVDAAPYYVETLGWLMIPFVLQNTGERDVYDAKVTAVAYDRKGELLVKTSSDDKYRLAPPEKVNPCRIEAGGKGYGILCLGNLRDYQGIKFRVTASEKPKASQRSNLLVVDKDIRDENQEAMGETGRKTVFGTARNDTTQEVHNVFVSVAGFDKEGKIVDFAKEPAEPGNIGPGATSSFSINIGGNRPIVDYAIVAAEGVDNRQ